MADKKVKAIPERYHSLTPYMTLRNAAQAIDFYMRAFGAEERVRMAGPNGQVMHAELRIGDSIFMLGDEDPQMGSTSPQTLGGASGGMVIYCENVDQAFDRAVKAGAKTVMAPADMFWGDRYGTLIDPFGHKWSIATHIKDVTAEQMKQAQDEWMKQMAQKKG
jgi:PhnB protein